MSSNLILLYSTQIRKMIPWNSSGVLLGWAGLSNWRYNPHSFADSWLEDMGYSSPPALRKKIQPSLSRHPLLLAPESHPNISQKRKWNKLPIWEFDVPQCFCGIDSDDIEFVCVCILWKSMNVYVYIYIYNTAQIQDTKRIWYLHHISFCEHFQPWAAQSSICLQPFVDKPTTEELDPHYRCANPNIQWQCQAPMGKVDCPSGGVPVGVGRRLQ